MTPTAAANQNHQQKMNQHNSNDKLYVSLEIAIVLLIVLFPHLNFISSCLNMRSFANMMTYPWSLLETYQGFEIYSVLLLKAS